MTEAVFGLVGVLLGGLISGGATYVLSRRNERLEAQASARLLQRELHRVAYKLKRDREAVELGGRVGFRPIGERPKRGDRRPSMRNPPLEWLEEFALDPWMEHQSRLARVLETEDWYALSDAYGAILDGQDLARLGKTERELSKGLSPAGIRFIDVPVLDDLHESVEAGAAALAKLAGRPLTERDAFEPGIRALTARSRNRPKGPQSTSL